MFSTLKMPSEFWLLDSNEFLSKSDRSYKAETFLASVTLTKTSRESSFWSDITSSPDGPARKQKLEETEIQATEPYHDFLLPIAL
jgi:hypothetical protein